ncbi:aminoglycoside phosphotransferase family protein [Amaricoccus macauensis]|uniref:aminoglycoside phosphotransferase family protein n=1 Tax=Amaricoccus macauensis TaxID=57001 RepID=UPI003C7E5ABE
MRSDSPVDDFLSAYGWQATTRFPLSGDASARRYERLRGPKHDAILMMLPNGNSDMLRSFLTVTDLLRRNGFSAPEILAVDNERGLCLLEDLGDDLIFRLCENDPALETPLYEAAIDVLAELHSLLPTRSAAGWSAPPYDLRTLLREAKLPLEWYLPEPASAELVEFFEISLTDAINQLSFEESVAVYRDYHSENLVWLPHRTGRKRVGLLDYQDMLSGHPAYDVVSLLEDARREVAPQLWATMTRRYLAQTDLDPDCFDYAAHLLSAQRNLKILGLFARLSKRDGKPRYLSYLPRVWRYLQSDLSHPGLDTLRNTVVQILPPPEAKLISRLAESQP